MQPDRQLFISKHALTLGIGLGLIVLAATLVWSTLYLRQHIRRQIAARDGEILDAVAMMQYATAQTNGETLAELDDPGEQMQLVLEVSRLRNVLGVRLFSPKAEFVNAFPAYITEGELHPEDMATLRELKPASHFLPQARLEQEDMLAESDAPTVPLLEVNLPLRASEDGPLVGVAQFLMNGASIAREYAEVDRRLMLQSGLAFLAGGTLLTVGLMVAFRRVQQTNQVLAKRTANLLQANRELALAAKASAVGAVASHLIHGLKNPLSGLRNLLEERALGDGNTDGTDWNLAAASTQRMQALINRVVRVLQEDQAAVSYEISVPELVELLAARMSPLAEAAGLNWRAESRAAGVFSNREADLILLVLENLVQNALEATPRGGCVSLSVSEIEGQLAFEVADNGPGLPAAMQERLFQPCHSSKEGGSGIGLAISHQLAKHVGAELELKDSSNQGSIFRLRLSKRATSAALMPQESLAMTPE